MSYPWYEVIKSSEVILQGDIVMNCPYIVPPARLENIEQELEINEMNAIVLSQSCDLEQNKIKYVLVCPYYQLSDFLKVHPESKDGGKGLRRVKEKLRDSAMTSYHLLNSDSEKGINDCLVVDFRNIFSIDISFLKSHAKMKEERFRLLPPYREHLSQAFARYLMRVGLPTNYNIEI